MEPTLNPTFLTISALLVTHLVEGFIPKRSANGSGDIQVIMEEKRWLYSSWVAPRILLLVDTVVTL